MKEKVNNFIDTYVRALVTDGISGIKKEYRAMQDRQLADVYTALERMETEGTEADKIQRGFAENIRIDAKDIHRIRSMQRHVEMDNYSKLFSSQRTYHPWTCTMIEYIPREPMLMAGPHVSTREILQTLKSDPKYSLAFCSGKTSDQK